MGDKITSAVSGKLFYISRKEIVRIISELKDPLERAFVFSYICRINALYMIARAGSGHIGSSFSSLDIISWLFLHKNLNEKEFGLSENIFFSSKGHDAPALYSVLIGLGLLDFNYLEKLRKLDGLPGHPDISTPHIVTNTGSLGMGISKAKGIIEASRLKGEKKTVYVLTGDGELQEGQFWESLISAKNRSLSELTVIVDHNKLQSDTLVSNVSDLGDLQNKLKSFGWETYRCDGNNLKDFSSTLEESEKQMDLPKIIIADTVKAKGVSFMEHSSTDSDIELYEYHSGAPGNEEYTLAFQELLDVINSELTAKDISSLEVESITFNNAEASFQKMQKLIPAYSSSLVDLSSDRDDIVALDADLVLDTGLVEFRRKFPDRFIECGIAEQDMVSQAGGLALSGLLPIVHSFSCFLTTRPNEQIYNNSTERNKIIYVGSLAGMLPGGPGHSHQSVKDISNMSNLPNMLIIEPSCELEVKNSLDFCINKNENSSYLRLCSIPYPVPFNEDFELIKGRGNMLLDGSDLVVFGYGPVLLTEAYKASKTLENKKISLKVINLPWLNFLDDDWFQEVISGFSNILTLDNHFIRGGQGDMLASSISRLGLDVKVKSLGLSQIPLCGTNEQVLHAHGLDSESISNQAISLLEG